MDALIIQEETASSFLDVQNKENYLMLWDAKAR